MDSLMRDMDKHPDPKQRFTEDEKAAIHGIWQRDQDARDAIAHATPKKEQERQAEEGQAVEQQAESDLKQAQKKSRRELHEAQPLFNEWKSEVAAGG